MFKTRLLLVLFVTLCATLAYRAWHARESGWKIAAGALAFPILSALTILLLTFLKAKVGKYGELILDRNNLLYRALTLDGELSPDSLCGHTWGGAFCLGILFGFVTGILAIVVLAIRAMITHGFLHSLFFLIKAGVALGGSIWIIYLICKLVGMGWHAVGSATKPIRKNHPVAAQRARRVATSFGEIALGTLIGTLATMLVMMFVIDLVCVDGLSWWRALGRVIGVFLGGGLGVVIILALISGISRLLDIPAVQAFKERVCPVVEARRC